MATIPTSIEVKLNSEQLQELLNEIDALKKRVAELESYFQSEVWTVPKASEGCTVNDAIAIWQESSL